MIRLRPYKNYDAKYIADWIKNESAYHQWYADRFKRFPITEDIIIEHYNELYYNDTFFALTALDDCEVIGHITMRFTDEDKKILRFGFFIVDDTKRNCGYGKEILRLALVYAFEILKVEKVILMVFENNPYAYQCYKSVGFYRPEHAKVKYYHVLGEKWKCLELEMLNTSADPVRMSAR